MNTVCEKGKCTGCMECIDICHKGAIQIVDSGMEYNAIIDSDKCTKCNACHKACQNNRKQDLTRPIYWKQGWARDNRIRMSSSSGGLAAAIERSFVKNGGMVCSCVFRSGRFEFEFAETEDDVSKFAGSKYIKSSPEGIYSKIEERLKQETRYFLLGCHVRSLQ